MKAAILTMSFIQMIAIAALASNGVDSEMKLSIENSIRGICHSQSADQLANRKQLLTQRILSLEAIVTESSHRTESEQKSLLTLLRKANLLNESFQVATTLQEAGQVCEVFRQESRN